MPFLMLSLEMQSMFSAFISFDESSNLLCESLTSMLLRAPSKSAEYISYTLADRFFSDCVQSPAFRFTILFSSKYSKAFLGCKLGFIFIAYSIKETLTARSKLRSNINPHFFPTRSVILRNII